jgi:hypothetical protein
MPGTGAAAAVLGFVEAGLALVLVAAILLDEADWYSGGGDTGILALVLVALLGLSGLTAVLSVLLLRGHGRALLVAATVVELVLLAGLWVVALRAGLVPQLQQGVPGRGFAAGPVLAVLAPVLVLLAMTVVVLTTGAGVVYDQPIPPR